MTSIDDTSAREVVTPNAAARVERPAPAPGSNGPLVALRNHPAYRRLEPFLPWVLGALGLVLFASATSAYVQLIAGTVLIYAISAIGLNLVMGQAGLVSIGNAALMAVGAYTTAILSKNETLSTFPLPIILSAMVGGIFGLLIALPALRLKGIYLALATLALQFFVVFAGDRYQSETGQLSGVMVPPLTIGGYTFVPGRDFLLLLGAFLGLTILVVRAVSRHAPGRMWTAIRESELAATAIGVNAARWKLSAFVVSSAIIAVSGSLFAYYNQIVSADSFTLEFAVVFIIILILGGMGTMSGAFVGSVVVVSLPYLLTYLTSIIPSGAFGDWLTSNVFYVNNGLYGLLVLVVLLYMPDGLVPSITSRVKRLVLRRSAASHAPAERPATSARPTRHTTGEGAALLEVTDLDVMYETGARAVSRISLRVERNAIVAVLGRNGAGKTSTLRAVSGFLPTEQVRVHGSMTFDGAAIGSLSPGRTAALGLVLVPERDKIFPSLTVHEHLRLAVASGYEEVIDKPYFHRLKDRLQQPAGLLSGGERQLLALATASVLKPRLLMVDEFTLGLAPVMIQEVARVIRGLRDDGMTILLVEQNAAAALDLADHVYLMEGGEVVADGTSDEMASHVTMTAEVSR
ncbi:branched-chain amino acid ABC transporter ATP-binding protein/permease [Intrasporangium mesophilum]